MPASHLETYKKVAASHSKMLACNREPEKFVQLGLAPMGGLVFDVKAGQKVSLNICLGFYLGGIVTHGTKHCKYYYTKFFNSIDEVFKHGLVNADYYIQIPSDEIHTNYPRAVTSILFL